jgi:hypothetical protein
MKRLPGEVVKIGIIGGCAARKASEGFLDAGIETS